MNTGANPNDIIQMIVYHGTKLQNTFYSQEKRSPNELEIPFEAEGGGRDIGWMYGALVRFREKGIAITPDEYSEYLAYKLNDLLKGIGGLERLSEKYPDKTDLIVKKVLNYRQQEIEQ